MHRPWYDSYPTGIPHDINPESYSSLVEVFHESCKTFSKRPCFSNFGKTLSFQQMEEQTRHLAAYLQKELKLEKGDHIAIMLPNLLQTPVSIFASLCAGLSVVNINPLYTSEELRHQLCDSGATSIIILENFASTLESVLHDTPVKNVIITRMGDMLDLPKSALINLVVKHIKKLVPPFSIPGAIPFRHCLKQGKHLQLDEPSLSQDDIAFLQYTGGTTGVAKGAILTHGNLVANLMQVSAWIEPYADIGHEHIITALPLYHIFSLTANCLFFMKIGGLNHLITNPRDMKAFVREIRHSRFTAITGVNTLFNGLLNTPGFDRVDFSHLRISLGGGMAVQKAVADRWQQVTGCCLLEAYGLTETSPAACINPMDLTHFNGKIGLPIPSTDVAIKDEDNRPLPVNEAGEICIRGPQVTQGYYNRPEETASVFDQEGFFHTGDIGYMDEKGYVQIVDRKKDMILVSGFNVYPNEIEAIIAMHDDVIEVGVIGVPDDASGELVMAVIVSSNPDLSLDDIQRHCEASLTRYKIPRRLALVQDVPKSNVGKILRRELRALYLEK